MIPSGHQAIKIFVTNGLSAAAMPAFSKCGGSVALQAAKRKANIETKQVCHHIGTLDPNSLLDIFIQGVDGHTVNLLGWKHLLLRAKSATVRLVIREKPQRLKLNHPGYVEG